MKLRPKPRRGQFIHRLTRNLPTIARMEIMTYDHTWSTHVHVPVENELLHVLHGHMELVTTHSSMPAGPGDTLLIPAGLPHRDHFDPAEPLVVFLCHFTWSLTQPYFERVDNRLIHSMPAAGKVELAQVFDQLRAMLFRATESDIQVEFEGWKVRTWGPTVADRQVANARLLTILLLILKQAEELHAPQAQAPALPRRPYRGKALVEKTKAYIAAHYSHDIGLREIAAQLGTSPYHLSHVFSREAELSFAAYLREVRLSKAQALLTEETYPIGNVARAVGYPNPNYFAKVFRKRFGITPTDFVLAQKT